jgi:hypothetical protein
MKKHVLASAIPAIISSAVFATPMPLQGPNVIFYRTISTSAGTSVVSSGAMNMYHVNNASSGASNTAEGPIMLTKWGEWFIDTGSGDFVGTIYYGNYKTQINETGIPTIDGRQTFTGVTQTFSDTATWTTPTHLSYSFLNTMVNGGGASIQTQNSYSCTNGVTSVLGKVCTNFATASKAWEGLSFEFDFFNSYYTFSGVLTGIDTSGAGLSRNTISTNWQIDAIDPPIMAPIPATAWLFGSGLIGLAGAARRRLKKT